MKIEALSMKIGWQQIKYIFLAIASGFVAWLSLGGIMGCAHFDIDGFCTELLQAGEFEYKKVLNSQCKTLAVRAELICNQYFKLGLSALVVSAISSYIFIGQAISHNVKDNWRDENS